MSYQFRTPGYQIIGCAVRRLLFSVGLGLMLGFCLLPILWQLVTALKPATELVTLPPLLPTMPTLDHFRAVFWDRPFARILLNSTGVAVLTTLVCLVIGTPAAFALAKLPMLGQQLIL